MCLRVLKTEQGTNNLPKKYDVVVGCIVRLKSMTFSFSPENLGVVLCLFG